MTRADLQQLADLRIEEAKILFRARKYSGAYYLAGYAVECGLKACIAKKSKRFAYPDKDLAVKCYTHDLERLVELAGMKALMGPDPQFHLNLTAVWEWSEQTRYQRKSRLESQTLLAAMTDPSHGVLPWIKTHW